MSAPGRPLVILSSLSAPITWRTHLSHVNAAQKRRSRTPFSSVDKLADPGTFSQGKCIPSWCNQPKGRAPKRAPDCHPLTSCTSLNALDY